MNITTIYNKRNKNELENIYKR